MSKLLTEASSKYENNEELTAQEEAMIKQMQSEIFGMDEGMMKQQMAKQEALRDLFQSLDPKQVLQI